MRPLSFRFLGKLYGIEWFSGDDPEEWGEAFSSRCYVKVCETQHEQQQADTLLHEAMHVIDHEMHCHMSEPQIRRMATGVLALLRDNPEIVRFLTLANPQGQ